MVCLDMAMLLGGHQPAPPPPQLTRQPSTFRRCCSYNTSRSLLYFFAHWVAASDAFPLSNSLSTALPTHPICAADCSAAPDGPSTAHQCHPGPPAGGAWQGVGQPSQAPTLPTLQGRDQAPLEGILAPTPRGCYGYAGVVGYPPGGSGFGGGWC